MRFLFVIAGDVRVELGGAQIALRLAEALRKVGHSVELRGATDWASPGLLRYSGGREARGLRRLLLQEDNWDVVDAPARLVSTLTEPRPILVSRNVQPELDYLRAEKLDDERRRLSLARRMLHGINRGRERRAVKRGWRTADLILCLGGVNHRRFAREHPEYEEKTSAYRVAPSLEEREVLLRIASERRNVECRLCDAKMLWIGRWSAHKGVAELTSFAQKFLLNRGQGHLTLAGTGVDPRRELPAEIVGSDRLRVVEAFDRERLPELLREHEVGLFTSRVEGWGLSLQEMLESGMPVFATDAGAVPELRKWFPSSLRPFPPRAEEMIGDDISGKAAQGYEEAFSWDRIAEDYLSAIRSVLPRRGGDRGRP